MVSIRTGRQVGAACIDKIDRRRPVLAHDRLLSFGTFATIIASRPDARRSRLQRRRLIVIDPICSQGTHFEKRRARIPKPTDAITQQQLAWSNMLAIFQETASG
jgi:hypothetical protein